MWMIKPISLPPIVSLLIHTNSHQHWKTLSYLIESINLPLFYKCLLEDYIFTKPPFKKKKMIYQGKPLFKKYFQFIMGQLVNHQKYSLSNI